MKTSLRVTLLIFAFLQAATLAAQERYIVKPGDPNGIHKWYMGRQIAQVMSHYGIGWLEREEREQEENTAQLMKNLAVQPGQVIADIGAGSGYHSALLSKMVENGKVYAVDVEPEMIAYLKDRIKSEGKKNIIPVLSTEKNVALPANSVDLMLLVDVYHEFSFPYEMARSMLEALKPGGKLVLVEFRAEDPNVPIKTIHKMSERQAVKEFKAAGFTFEKNISNLPWQHCLIFRKSENQN
ncbi:MAG: class I SAM-dependent methyltransferase [Algoriphagus sp.]